MSEEKKTVSLYIPINLRKKAKEKNLNMSEILEKELNRILNMDDDPDNLRKRIDVLVMEINELDSQENLIVAQVQSLSRQKTEKKEEIEQIRQKILEIDRYSKIASLNQIINNIILDYRTLDEIKEQFQLKGIYKSLTEFKLRCDDEWLVDRCQKIIAAGVQDESGED